MAESFPLLTFYLQGLRRAFDATSGTLFVPSAASMLTQSFLVHDGPVEAIPELSTMERSTSFLVSLVKREYEAEGEADDKKFFHGVYFKSHESGAVIIPLLFGHDAFSLPHFGDHDQLEYTEPATQDASSAAAQQQRPQYHKSPAWLGLSFGPDADVHEALKQHSRGDAFDIHGWLEMFGGSMGRHLVRMDAVLHDQLTGLPGPGELLQLLEELIARPNAGGDGFAVLVFCPERCGEVSDQYSEQISQGVLVQAARCMHDALKGNEFLARIGLTSFAMVLPETNSMHTQMVAQHLMQDVSRDVQLEDMFPLILNCGITYYGENNNVSPIALVQQATKALEKAMKRDNKDLLPWKGESILQSQNLATYQLTLTGESNRDARRMELLQDLLVTATMEKGSDEALNHVSGCFQRCFGVHDSVLLRGGAEDDMQTVHSVLPITKSDEEDTAEAGLSSEEQALIKSGCAAGEPVGSQVVGLPESEIATDYPAIVIPLFHGDTCAGALFMRGGGDKDWLDISDVLFLSRTARHLGKLLLG